MTVKFGKRLNCWKTIPAFCRSLSISFLCSTIETLSRITSPFVGSSRRLRQRRKVLFPEPDGQITQTTSPLETVALIPLKTSSSPKYLWRSITLITSMQSPLKAVDCGCHTGRHYQIDICNTKRRDQIVICNPCNGCAPFI